MIKIIKLKNIKKSYNSNLIFNNLNLEINKGDIFGIAGISGTGKSTLLRCINKLEKIDSGSIIIDNKDITNLDDVEMRVIRKEIGMIFQNYPLLDRLSVFDNIALPMRCWGYKKEDIERRVEETLDIIGMKNKSKSRPSQLSGGQKQRVAIARAISMHPKILLCDEPTSSLDPITTNSIIELLKEINRRTNMTIVIVSHEINVLTSLCENIGVLENNNIHISNDIEDYFRKDSRTPNSGLDTFNVEVYLDNTQYINLIEDLVEILDGEISISGLSNKNKLLINTKLKKKDILTEYLKNKNILFKEGI